jgi:hypothetical protein
MSSFPGAQPDAAQSQPRLVSYVKQYQPLLAVCGCMISFLAGYAWKFYDAQDRRAQEWREALSTINPNGPNQLQDALRIQSFEQYSDYRVEAREVEAGILPRMVDPELFDHVYFLMQNGSRQGEVVQLEQIDRALSREIRSLMSFADFSAEELKLSPNQRLQRLLLNPAEYLSDERLTNRADTVIYELDSVSGGLHCVFKQDRVGCPSLRPTGEEAAEMILVNHDFSGVFRGPGNQPSLFKTCSVQTVHAADMNQNLKLLCE